MTYSEGPRLGPDNNPGGARWCPDHGRLECTKNRSKGRGPCHGAAVRGLDACKIHAGVSTKVARVKGETRISAWSAMGSPANGKGIDSGAAVIGMLQQSWLRANLYSHLLQLQVRQDGTDEAGVDGGGTKGTNGLIGYRYGAAGSDGHIYAVSEEARALVALEAAERDRVVRYAKTAHEMGISDKMIGMAERWGDTVVSRIMIILAGLQLTSDQEAMVPALIQAHLGSIELGT
jgi:hypothetical protein